MSLFENDDDTYPTNPYDEATYLATIDAAIRVRPASPRWEEN